jgi:GT2 family glycosyltransferase
MTATVETVQAAPTPVTVSILIVSYNTRELTTACIQSVVQHVRDVSYELLVVDNASEDGSADAIRALVPQARLFALQKNIGFAAANNLASCEARGEYLLLLNPDTLLLDDAVFRLVEFARANPGAGVWGGRTLYGNGALNPTSCWRRMTLWGLTCGALGLRSMFRNSPVFNPEGYGGWKRDTAREIDIVTGCFLLITRTLWDALGGFDPAFFMYGEDADLCLRARERGHRPMITPAATIIHHGGRSERSKPDKIIRLLRARQMLIRRHWSRLAAPVGLALLRMAIFSRRITHALRGEDDPRLGKWETVWQRRDEWANGSA